MDPRGTYYPSISALVSSKAESIKPVFEIINLSYIAQNHSSMTILIQFVYRYQMCITNESLLPNMTHS